MAMSPRLLRPRASGFNPRAISGLIAWYDAADSATLTVSTGVSSWADKSGNGYTLRQSIGNNQPATGTRTIGGKNALDFDGSNDLLSLGTTPPEYLLNLSAFRALTLFAVLQSDSPNSIRRVASLQRTGKNSNDTGVYFGRHVTSSGSTEMAAGAGDSTSNDQASKNFIRSFSDTSGDAGIYCASVSAADNALTIHKNGTSQTLTTRYGTGSASAFLGEGTGNHTLDIGANRGTSNAIDSYWDGMVGEVLIFTRRLSDTERAAVQKYLGGKWGITVA